MSKKIDAALKGKQAIVKLFVAFVGISSLLFFAVVLVVFIPLVNDSFDALQEKYETQTVQSYATKLSSYLDNRLLLLKDVAKSPLMTNAVLMADGNPALIDFMRSVRVLGEDPMLTLVDTESRVLFGESVDVADYQWTQLLLETGDVNEIVRFIEAGKSANDEMANEMPWPLFELAVPIIYRNGRAGILVARVNASPSQIYTDKILISNNSAVTYSLKGKEISSPIDMIESPNEQSFFIAKYSIDLTHIVSRNNINKSKKSLLIRFLLSAFITTIVMCLLLFFFGRKLILKTYVQLSPLQNTFAKATEGVSFIDASGRYVSLNYAYASMAGYTPQELEERLWSVTVFPEDLPALEEVYQEMLREGIATAEARGITKEGNVFYKQVTMITQYDDHGVMTGHHCFIKDISSRKKNEQQQEGLIQALARTNTRLVESQEKILVGEKNLHSVLNFQMAVFDNVPDMLFVKDSGLHIVQANKAFLNFFPEDMRNDVIGNTLLEEFDVDEREASSFFDRMAFNKGVSETEETIQFPDGRVRTLLTKKVRFEDESGATFILAVASDITDIKQAQKELLKSEQRYEVAVKGSSVGLWDFDVATDELYWSDRFKEMVGVNEEFTGHISEFADRLHPEDKAETLRVFNAHLEQKSPYVVDYRFRKVDGDYIWIHSEGQALWDEQGMPVRVAGSVDDITQRKKADIDRERLIDSLAKSNEGLEHFAFICSHDLQEPLRVIRSFSERLQGHIGKSLEGDDKAQLYFKFIVDGAARAQELIADVLAYSRIDNDTQVLKNVNSEKLVKAVKQHLQIGIDGDQRKVSCDTLPVIVGNKTQLYQLLQNLINNGLKYQAAGVLPEVHISAANMDDNFWQFSVRDNGIGIELRYQKQIFDVFKRLHGQGEYAGSGIGLAICKKVVERHGGRLWVDSEKDRGATFHFTLPKADH
ncbi:MAG: PAS domain S-box-containing protein [Candidatus Endobugula sp.]|jgi:PAS domain S-box-containing protein